MWEGILHVTDVILVDYGRRDLLKSEEQTHSAPKKSFFIYYSWGELQRDCEFLAMRIRQCSRDPDVILGISRGGLVPATLVSSYLGCSSILSILPNKPSFFPSKVLLSNKKVVVVDDVVDSGQTLKKIRKYLENSSPLYPDPDNILFVTLHWKTCSIFIPHIYAQVIPSNFWIVYPWERQLSLEK